MVDLNALQERAYVLVGAVGVEVFHFDDGVKSSGAFLILKENFDVRLGLESGLIHFCRSHLKICLHFLQNIETIEYILVPG